MFDRFNDQARRVVILAQEEARMLNHHYVGTEHILLALTRGVERPDCQVLAARILGSRNVHRDEVRDLILGAVGQGSQDFDGHIPFTPLAKQSLDIAWREANNLGSSTISAEHLLLGLAGQTEGVAITALNTLSDAALIREEVIRTLTTNPSVPEPIGR
jgi:ATP-dependent Clp protease ATP-binding subunit ClpC